MMVARGDAPQTSPFRNGERVRVRCFDAFGLQRVPVQQGGDRHRAGRDRASSLRLDLEDRCSRVEPSLPLPSLITHSGDPTVRPASQGTDVAPSATEMAAPAIRLTAPEPAPPGSAALLSQPTHHRRQKLR